MNKTVCVYHNQDLDGQMSAAIVKHWFMETYKPKTHQPVKNLDGEMDFNDPDPCLYMKGYNYGQPIPNLSEYDKVILCDISFPKEEMSKLWHRLDQELVWIDHHISAINHNSDLVYKGFQDVDFAACELTWKYFMQGMNGDPDKESEQNTMPEIVRLLGRYDCFGHKGTDEEQKVLEFQYGARSVISNYEEAYKYLRQYNHNFKNSIVNMFLDKGKAIYSYLCTEAKQTYAKAFPISLREYELYPGGNTTGVTILRDFLTVNQERFNPINFGIDYHKDISESFWCIERKDEYGLLCHDGSIDNTSQNVTILKYKNKIDADNCHKHLKNKNEFYVTDHMWTSKGYDGFACFWYRNGKWNWSLYNGNGEVDCSVIAKQFGGGGHKSASGFILNNEQQFKLLNNK
jgi:oligoribonuclease NrnB/cAMP/cGMP phosphodiesterase (DHH superfamily)